MVLGVFAVLGLVLVALGVFSVVAYAVSRQTHEISALVSGRLQDEYETVRTKVHRW